MLIFVRSSRENPVGLILLIMMAIMGVATIVGGLRGVFFWGYIGVGPNDAWILGSMLLVISVLSVGTPTCSEEMLENIGG